MVQDESEGVINTSLIVCCECGRLGLPVASGERVCKDCFFLANPRPNNSQAELNHKEFKKDLGLVLEELELTLIEKNKSYGDSALNPCRIFSKADALEQINVRIDDKLNRMMQGTEYPGDNDELDLLGYLLLRRIKRLRDERG